MKFTKMHGLGNDYIFVDCFAETVTDPSRTAQLLSPAHFGVGADGLILIEPSAKADCRMRMFNADGTEGRMCGNGIRCVGKYMYDHGRAVKAEITVETLVQSLVCGMGVGFICGFIGAGDKAAKIRVDMGVPVLESPQPEKITVAGSEWEFSAVDVGSPHAVYLVPNCEEVPLEKIGVLFEHAARFPNRVNSEFVQILDRTHLRMRVWERGSGITLACGTGAVASVVASHARGLTDASVEVQMDGGALRIEIDDTTGHTFMTGPAVEVFQGETTLVD